MKFNVPGRVIDFYRGGGAYQAWRQDLTDHQDWPDTDERELFEAVRDGARRSAKGGWWVSAELSDAALKALGYWAETLQTASQDDASWEPDARNDLRAATNTLAKLNKLGRPT